MTFYVWTKVFIITNLHLLLIAFVEFGVIFSPQNVGEVVLATINSVFS